MISKLQFFKIFNIEDYFCKNLNHFHLFIQVYFLDFLINKKIFIPNNSYSH